MPQYEKTPKTQQTFRNAVVIKSPIDQASGYGKDINLSHILTTLIQKTGRFTERFASDLFISWEDLIETMNDIWDNKNENETAEFIKIFGLRESGVDGNLFTINRLKGTQNPSDINRYVYVQYVYRKIYALSVTIHEDKKTDVKLYDITNNIIKIAQEDLDD